MYACASEKEAAIFDFFFPRRMTNLIGKNTSTTKYDKWFECRLETKNEPLQKYNYFIQVWGIQSTLIFHGGQRYSAGRR